jgi:hypothetical protein
MYATRRDSPVYHLLDTRPGLTVCGLRFRRLNRAAKTVLTETPTQPLDKIICKNCVKMAEPDIMKTRYPTVWQRS